MCTRHNKNKEIAICTTRRLQYTVAVRDLGRHPAVFYVVSVVVCVMTLSGSSYCLLADGGMCDVTSS